MRRPLLTGFLALLLFPLLASTAGAVPDPRTPGSFTTAVTVIDDGCSYDLDGTSLTWSDPAFGFGPTLVAFGDNDFGGSDTRCPGSPAVLVDMKVRVHYPGTAGVVAAGGPFPLVMILHGQQLANIPGFEGYDYLGTLLASHGFIVASIDGRSLLDSTIKSRGEHVREHLRRMVTRNAPGSGSFLSGALDMSSVALIGHSRGGDAVVATWEWQRVDPDPGYGIGAIVAIAPVQFFGRIGGEPGFISHVRDVAYQILHGAHDCDVSDFQGLRTYDRSADIRAVGATPKSMVYVKDANHNFFNTVWQTQEGSDCGGGSVLSAALAQDVAKAYIHAFLDHAVKGSATFTGYLTGEVANPVAGTTVALDSQTAAPDFLAVDHFEELPGVLHRKARNSLGGPVAISRVTYTEAPVSSVGTYPGDTYGAHVTWFKPNPKLTEKAKAGQPIVPGPLDHLSFRVGQVVQPFGGGFNPPGANQDLRIQIRDGQGHLSNLVAVSAFGSIPPPFPSLFGGGLSGTKTVMSVVRIPLSAFTGVNLAAVKEISFIFTSVATGDLAIDDIRFTR